MRIKKYWQSLTAITICSILICYAPIVHATGQNSIEQNIGNETVAQDKIDLETDNNTPSVLTYETDESDETDAGIDCKATVLETDKLMFIPDTIDYMYCNDILFKFNNGTGDGALQKITEVAIFPYESTAVNQKNNAIVTLDYESECFSYDIEKGELILKNDALKEKPLIPGKLYCVIIRGNMMDGTHLELDNSKDWIINCVASPELTPNKEEDTNRISEETEQINLFSQITDIDVHSDERHVVDLANANASLSAAEMENLIGINQTKDVVIHTNDGVTFTFLKNSMKMVDGKEIYDFGVQLISDCQQAGVEMPKGDFVFRIKYHNTGELPGIAQVSIPVGSQWAGQEVFYAAIDDRGILYMSTETVDTNGIYTIPDLWFTL